MISKRSLGSIVVVCSLAALLLVASILFSGKSTQAGPATSVPIDNNATRVPSAQAENSENSASHSILDTRYSILPQTNGAWADIAPFPTINAGFPCGYPAPCTPQPNIMPARIKRAAAVAYPPNDKIYLLGGRHGLDGNEDFPLQYIFEYDPGSDAWTRKNALLDGSQTRDRYIANMAVAVLTDANGPRIYAVGGSSIDAVPTAAVRVYDPAADVTPVSLSSDPWPANPVHIPGGWGVYQNKLYLFGGFSALGAGAVFTETWRFDPLAPSGQKWVQLANLNLGRAYCVGAVLDGKLYAIGGDAWNAATRQLTSVNNVEMLDLTQPNPSWANVASLPSARGDMGAWAYDTGTGYEISGKIMVAGGQYPAPDAFAFIYNPLSNVWISAPGMNHATRNYAFAQLDGFLYALGGYDYSDGVPTGANFSQRYDATGPAITPTGTPPTATTTRTRTSTPTPTPTSCANYGVITGTATIAPGTVDIGNHGDDEVTAITLPFAFHLYDHTYSSVNLSSNGNAQFETANNAYNSECLPSTAISSYAIFPYWVDQCTGPCESSVCTGCGVYTSTTGMVPNRIFNIEWRTNYYDTNDAANYELRLYESAASTTSQFDIIYGATAQGAFGATAGVQKNGALYTQYFCDVSGGPVSDGLLTRYTLPSCATPSATSSSTSTPTSTPQFTNTPTPPPTNTSTVQPTLTACSIQFSDVPQDNPFYPFIRCLACRGIVNGYPDGAFLPGNSVTRGQLAKIVSNAAGFTDTPTGQTFEDVPGGTTFYTYTERLASRGVMSGYQCAQDITEPCVPPANRPYFRPYANSTRGQIAKIVSNAARFTDPPAGQTFEDVPGGTTFYTYTERLASRGVMVGYPCGNPEPCILPGNRPYFRPGATATRGQTSKIASNTFYPNCQTSSR